MKIENLLAQPIVEIIEETPCEICGGIHRTISVVSDDGERSDWYEDCNGELFQDD